MEQKSTSQRLHRPMCGAEFRTQEEMDRHAR